MQHSRRAMWRETRADSVRSNDSSGRNRYLTWLRHVPAAAGGFRRLGGAAVLRLAAVLGGLLLQLSPAAADRIFTLGSIGGDALEEITTFTPLADYVAQHLQDHGISRGQVLVARDMQEMARLMRQGQVDAFIDSPMPSLIVAGLSGATPVLRRWKKGQAEYRSVIFVRDGENIRSLGDLQGKVVAFEEAYSTAGFWLPRALMEDHGIRLAAVAPGGPAPAGPVAGYRFSADDENTFFWVLKGLVSAGAMSEAQFREFAGQDGAGLRILARTDPVPRHLVSLAASLQPELQAAIVDTLLGMEHSAEGRDTLAAFERTARFDAIPPEQAQTLSDLDFIKTRDLKP